MHAARYELVLIQSAFGRAIEQERVSADFEVRLASVAWYQR